MRRTKYDVSYFLFRWFVVLDLVRLESFRFGGTIISTAVSYGVGGHRIHFTFDLVIFFFETTTLFECHHNSSLIIYVLLI